MTLPRMWLPGLLAQCGERLPDRLLPALGGLAQPTLGERDLDCTCNRQVFSQSWSGCMPRLMCDISYISHCTLSTTPDRKTLNDSQDGSSPRIFTVLRFTNSE